MTSVRKRGEQIRRFILANVESHPDSITNHTAKKFGVSRQAVNKHLARLVDEKALSREGTTRNRRYALVPLIEWSASYKLPETREEHTVWRDHIQPRLSPLPDNAMGIWSHGFTEMFNNAIDHSNGKMVSVKIKRTAVSTSTGSGSLRRDNRSQTGRGLWPFRSFSRRVRRPVVRRANDRQDRIAFPWHRLASDRP